MEKILCFCISKHETLRYLVPVTTYITNEHKETVSNSFCTGKLKKQHNCTVPVPVLSKSYRYGTQIKIVFTLNITVPT